MYLVLKSIDMKNFYDACMVISKYFYDYSNSIYDLTHRIPHKKESNNLCMNNAQNIDWSLKDVNIREHFSTKVIAVIYYYVCL